MLSTEEIIRIAGEAIANSGTPNVVIDPVMVCKGDDEVLNPRKHRCYGSASFTTSSGNNTKSFEAGQLAGTGTPKTLMT